MTYTEAKQVLGCASMWVDSLSKLCTMAIQVDKNTRILMSINGKDDSDAAEIYFDVFGCPPYPAAQYYYNDSYSEDDLPQKYWDITLSSEWYPLKVSDEVRYLDKLGERQCFLTK